MFALNKFLGLCYTYFKINHIERESLLLKYLSYNMLGINDQYLGFV